jgi:hypothetical protein
LGDEKDLQKACGLLKYSGNGADPRGNTMIGAARVQFKVQARDGRSVSKHVIEIAVETIASRLHSRPKVNFMLKSKAPPCEVGT